MQSGARVALGIGAGYVLGRTRKMRLALMAAAAASGAVRGRPRELWQRGVSKLGSATDLDPVSRGMDLIKSAAMTAAGSQIDSLTERIRATTPGNRDDEGREDRQDDDLPEDEFEDEYEDEDEYDEAAEEDEDEAEDEEEDDEDEAVEEEPAPRRVAARRTPTAATRRSATSNGSPVRRTRR